VTEILETVAISNINDKKEKCPFCPNKSLSDCKAKKQEPIKEVVSKPNQLACTPLIPKGDVSYTTAKHHLISAKQCYAKLKRLVRMGSMAKYDINDPPNGIALPTVSNNLRYTVGEGAPRKYGKLSASEKKTVAFAVMSAEKAQWHVGHHAVTIELADEWADEKEDTPWRRGHLVSYDNEVIAKLLKLLSKFSPEETCDEKKPDNFKAEMDALSAEIKGKLNAFKGPNPGGSSPFFVSQLSADFAKASNPLPEPPKKKLRGPKK
jgi:hypothetical protein